MNTLDWKNATPEQINLWKYVKGLIAYTTVTPLYYRGLYAGSEFATFNAGKLYIALSLLVHNGESASAAIYWLDLYNMSNWSDFYVTNNYSHWDGTDDTFWANNILLNNVWFSRIEMNGATMVMTFNGYRLNV